MAFNTICSVILFVTYNLFDRGVTLTLHVIVYKMYRSDVVVKSASAVKTTPLYNYGSAFLLKLVQWLVCNALPALSWFISSKKGFEHNFKTQNTSWVPVFLLLIVYSIYENMYFALRFVSTIVYIMDFKLNKSILLIKISVESWKSTMRVSCRAVKSQLNQ